MTTEQKNEKIEKLTQKIADAHIRSLKAPTYAERRYAEQEEYRLAVRLSRLVD